MPWTQTFNVSLGTETPAVTCVAVAGATSCTIEVNLPVGTDALTIGAYDGSGGTGDLLSQAVVSESIKAGADDTLPPILLDGNPGSIEVQPPGSGVTGSLSAGFIATGSSPVSFTLTALDTLGTPFGTQPGAPTIHAYAFTPAFATAAIVGTQLTITPAEDGSAKIGLYLIAANGDGSAAFTNSTASIVAGATSVAVASTVGFGAGQQIVLDANTSSAEDVTVQSVGTGTLTIGKTAQAHAAGASVASVGTNGLGLVYQPLYVTISSTVVALGGCASPGSCQIDEFAAGSAAFVERTPPIGPSGFPYDETVNILAFDSADTLYNADTNDYTIDEFSYNNVTDSSNPTAAQTISGNSLDGNTDAQIGLAVSSNGTAAAAIDTSSSTGLTNPVGPQLVAFAPGGVTSALTHEFTNSGGSDFSAAAIGTQPSVAVMTGPTGTVIGYAVALVNLTYGVNGSGALNKIGIVYPDGTEQSITAGIGGNYDDPGNPIIAWDQSDQALIFIDTASGDYNVLEYKYAGSDTFASATTIASLSGGAVDLCVSRDGEIAVAYTPSGTSNAVVVYDKTTHTTVDLNLALGSNQIDAVGFFPDDSLLVVAGLNTVYDYVSVGGKPTAPAAFSLAPSDVPSGWAAFDAAISL